MIFRSAEKTFFFSAGCGKNICPMARRQVETGVGKYVNRHLFLYLEVGSCRNQDGTMRGGASLGAYVLFACLRVVCLILVQEVSKSCGRGHKGFLQMRENRFFSPCVPACPEYAILRRRKWQFDKMIFGQKNIRTKSLLRLENMFFCSYV